MGCGTSMVKYILFFFNFLFVIAGILLITAGALSFAGYDKYLDLAKEVELDAYKAPPILMMIIGSIVFLIAFLGCCGTMQESNCMMMTYAFVLSLLLIAEVGIVIVALVYSDDFEKVLHEGFGKSIKKYGINDDPVMESWNSMQQNLKCCGIDDYKDWEQTSWTVKEKLVPISCCIKAEDGCSDNVFDQSPEFVGQTIYTEGCLKKALNDIGTQYITIGAGVVAAIELVGIIFACCLAGRFRRKQYAV